MKKMRSLQFVPAKEKFLKRSLNITSDAIIIDLEDSVPASEKDLALGLVKEFLDDKKELDIPCFIRLNSDRIETEIKDLYHYNCGYMIPKFEGNQSFENCEKYFEGKEVIALVETPLGVINIEKTAKNALVNYIAFGAEDYTTNVSMKNSAETLYYQKSILVTYAKAYNKKVFDTPSFNYKDLEGLRDEVRSAVDLGFDGKLSIHPVQNQVINEEFDFYDLDFMKEVIEEFEKNNGDVLVYKNKVYEIPHINHYKRILKDRNN